MCVYGSIFNGKCAQLDVGITDEGARAIAGALERNQSLHILYVGECAITADGEQVRKKSVCVDVVCAILITTAFLNYVYV